MKQLFFIISLFIVSYCFAQEQEQLVGKWVFKDLHNAEHLDEASKSIAKTQLQGQLFFLLKDSGQFEANIMGEESRGEWILSNTTHLELTTDEGTLKFEILKFSKKEIILQVGEGAFLMEKKE